MKQLAFLIFTLLVSNVNAQNSAQGANTPTQQVYKAENEGWVVNVEEAYQLSKKSGKPILVNFTGSDWCGWCKKLTAAVFSKPEFATWAKDNVVLLELDFPSRKYIPEEIRQQNNAMQQALQVQGYPSVFLLNLKKDEATNNYNIEVLGRTGYRPTVDQFITDVKNMMAK